MRSDHYQPPPALPVYPPATVDSTKTFCALIADGANLLLDGLGDIDMSDVELPASFFAARHPSSSRPSPTPGEVVEALSKSIVYTRPPIPTPSSSAVSEQGAPTGSLRADAERGSSVDSERGRRSWVAPLHMAARKGQDNIVRTLLQYNADCNQEDGDGLTPLLHATMGGYSEIVGMLLSRGARIDLVDGRNRSALHWATIQQQEAVLRLLLENGGDKPTVLNQHDSSGMTPLHIAVSDGFEAGVHLLLQVGASVNC